MFVTDSPENRRICMEYCGTCPSYGKENGKLLFCSSGNLRSCVDRKGCKCGMCPIGIKRRLDGSYYCIHGNFETFIE